MSAYELLLSESQERMLVVVQKGHEEDIVKIFKKWDLHVETIGEVIDGDRLVISYRGRKVADVPPDSLVLGGGAPVYTRETREPGYLRETRAFREDSVPKPDDMNEILVRLMGTPNIASKRWVYEQYDSMVRTNNMILSEADAAVVLIKDTGKAVSMKTDCNGRYVYLNPRRGAMIAVAESARNVVCTGATPLAITNCLNFGNPYKPEVYWQFKEAVAGIGEACRAFDTPVTGGNVSFYNESPKAAVYPTPVIGMIGLVENLEMVTTSQFKQAGDTVILLGDSRGHLGGSEYLSTVHGIVAGDAPELDLQHEIAVQKCLLEAIRTGLIESAHDCSEGGIAVALAECCVGKGADFIGADLEVAAGQVRTDGLLFGEDQSRIVVSAHPENVKRVLDLAASRKIKATVLGTTGGQRLRIKGLIDLSLNELATPYFSAISRLVGDEEILASFT